MAKLNHFNLSTLENKEVIEYDHTTIPWLRENFELSQEHNRKVVEGSSRLKKFLTAYPLGQVKNGINVCYVRELDKWLVGDGQHRFVAFTTLGDKVQQNLEVLIRKMNTVKEFEEFVTLSNSHLSQWVDQDSLDRGLEQGIKAYKQFDDFCKTHPLLIKGKKHIRFTYACTLLYGKRMTDELKNLTLPELTSEMIDKAEDNYKKLIALIQAMGVKESGGHLEKVIGGWVDFSKNVTFESESHFYLFLSHLVDIDWRDMVDKRHATVEDISKGLWKTICNMAFHKVSAIAHAA